MKYELQRYNITSDIISSSAFSVGKLFVPKVIITARRACVIQILLPFGLLIIDVPAEG